MANNYYYFYSIPFSAIAAAKSFRRFFKLEYVDNQNDRCEIEIKLARHCLAAGLYRSITERHAFYVCDKVRGVVTNQFTRDLKGTIASMFKEDTELGKRYVFDIQRTSREVHDQARRILYERGLELSTVHEASLIIDDLDDLRQIVSSRIASPPDCEAESSGSNSSGNSGVNSPCQHQKSRINSNMLYGGSSIMSSKLDAIIRERQEREAAIGRCVDTRISEAMTCKICMDRSINTMFSPCCHVMACEQCATR